MDLVAPRTIQHLTTAEIVKAYGAKTAGLVEVPFAWRPSFLLLSGSLYRGWLSSGRSFSLQTRKDLNSVLAAAVETLGKDCLLRSSATDETIHERGTYISKDVDIGGGVSILLSAAAEIFADYRAKDSDGDMCLILQTRVKAARQGFLSNELRLADKPYRWAVQTEFPTTQGIAAEMTMLSAKQATAYDIEDPLICTSRAELTARLRSVARHFWREAKGRLLLEWCWDGSRLWIVQRDQCVELTGGVNPQSVLDNTAAVPALEDGQYFRRYQVGSSSPWGKLRKVADFGTSNSPPPHRLFYATAGAIRGALATEYGRLDLAQEIDALTAGRAVIRTDSVAGGYNLPRTHTVTGDKAVEWMEGQLAGISDDASTVFILHAFIHARAAAWSYFKRGDPSVRVDGLWGLADGMQFYPFDTFLYFPGPAKEVSTTRFKSHVLMEREDGEWCVCDVEQLYARRRSLSKTEVKDIAERTIEISRRTESDVQIMWFAGIPSKFNLGGNLPWFIATAEQNIVEHRSQLLRSVTIRASVDLDKLIDYEPNSVKVILEPSAADIRSETFVETVAETCRRLRLPVEIRGSILSHAFHQLTKAGVQVFSAEPGKTSLELRQRKSFHKLVRDHIPAYIEEKGERVSSARIDRDELVRALVGKLIEETTELLAARTDAQRVEELADMLEVIRGLASSSDIAMNDVESMAKKKREKRGGFERGIVLQSTSLESQAQPDDILFDEVRNARQSRVKLRDLADRNRKPERTNIPAEELLSGLVARRTLEIGKQSVSIRVELDSGYVAVTLDRVTDLSNSHQIDLLREPKGK